MTHSKQFDSGKHALERTRGFTLMELMVVMAIIAITAAIAYPAYLKSAEKGRRTDAKAALTKYAQALERCYTEYGVYTNSNCPVISTLRGAGYSSDKQFYVITAPSATSTTYALRAAAVSSGPQAKDTGCNPMTLDNQGNQGPSGCW